LSVFWTREDPQPTSEFVVACPCPDGLMQDGTPEGNDAYVILHRGARSRGYKRRERESARERERERVRSCGEVPELASVASLLLCLPSLVPFSLRPSVRVMSPLLRACCPRALGRPWMSPFIDTRRWPSCTMGCSYVLTWLAEKCLEPCSVLMWLSEKCLEPCRSIAGGAAWMLLTFPCFRRRLGAI
jgi:hypothetical protein